MNAATGLLQSSRITSKMILLPSLAMARRDTARVSTPATTASMSSSVFAKTVRVGTKPSKMVGYLDKHSFLLKRLLTRALSS